jgi:hypothetical protein
MSPLKISAPVGEPSWIATLCGVPASLFLKSILNAWPAGAVSVDSLKATPSASISRVVPPPEAAGADAGAEADAAGCDAGADAEPLGAAAEPLASTLGIGVADGAGA